MSSQEHLIQLGFAEPFEEEDWDNEELDGVRFHSKVGGKPSFLNFKTILGADDVRCSRCEKPMTLLLQLYAPLDEVNNDAFHRMLYVFVCQSGSCVKTTVLSQNALLQTGAALRKPSVAVYRSQLPENNKFYELDIKNDDSNEVFYRKPGVPLADVCRVSGLFGKFSCSKCGKVRYASKEFQAIDWKARHKEECAILCEQSNKALADVEAEIAAKKTTDKATQKGNIGVFAESEIVTEAAEDSTQGNPDPNAPDSDDESDSEGDDAKEVERKKRNEDLIKHHEKTTKEFDKEEIKVEELVHQPKAVSDKFFQNFQRYMDIDPEQILRYYENFEMSELWVNKGHQLPKEKIPACPHCKAPRRPEFQVVPQILNFLNLDDPTSEEALDFGTIVIYTCSKSCSKVDAVYLEEFAWVQPIMGENDE